MLIIVIILVYYYGVLDTGKKSKIPTSDEQHVIFSCLKSIRENYIMILILKHNNIDYKKNILIC